LPGAWQEGLGNGPAPDADWFKGFGSPVLDALIAEALTQNADVAMAEARLRQADARLRVAGAALVPTANAAASVTRVSGSSGGESAHETDRALQFAASYEFDFWGAARAAQSAARQERRASAAEADLVRLSIEASVAEVYITILELRAQQQHAQHQLELLTDGLAGLEARNSAGMVSAVELSLYRSTLAGVRVAAASLRQQEIEASAALALLVGRNAPVALPAEQTLRALRVPPAAGATPTEVLARRPDIASAEAALAAADANVIAARAALLPRLTLDAVLARQNPGFQAALTTLSGTGNSLSLGATLVQTLFDGGKAKAQRAETIARREELIASYRKAILTALIDVQRALSIEQETRHQQADAEQAEGAARAMAESLSARSAAGLGDRLATIEAERALSTAQDARDHAQALQLKASIGLFKALGGGWKNEVRQ
jgi:NodT family efflux transporter outer membrane factor (OMF) lipoprotein